MAGGYNGETDPLVAYLMSRPTPAFATANGKAPAKIGAKGSLGAPVTGAALGSALLNPQLASLQAQSQQIGQQLQNVSTAGQNPGRSIVGTGLNLMADALLHGKQKDVNSQLVQAQMEQRLSNAKALFPNDEQGQLAYITDPESMSKSFAARYGPQDVRAGNTLLNAPAPAAGTQGSAPGTYTAPKMDVVNDRPTMQTPAGMTTQTLNGQPGAALPPSPVEQAATNQAATAQAAQQAQVQQAALAAQQRAQEIAVAQRNAASQATSAGAAAAGAATGQANSPNVGLPPGYVIGGPPR